MQQALKNLNYSVSADGVFGALTQSAVIAFQSKNNLTADGVAGAKTLEKLYSGSAVGNTTSSSLSSSSASSGDSSAAYGTASGPDGASVQCLYWYTEVKPNLSTGSHITVFDPATNLQWTLRVYSRGRHADCEPLTADDTATMYQAFGGVITWTPKPVYVRLPDGRWTLAAMHDVAHLSGSISDNNFDGHLCVHFLRTIAETMELDSNYGMTNQNTIRNKWKQLTGITIAD
jgi:peptidoglycan hydrolase-like protein with peptidoglycan-binding domain